MTTSDYTPGFIFKDGKWTKANFLKVNAHATPEAVQAALLAGERILVPEFLIDEASALLKVPVPGYPDYLFP